MIEQEQWKLLEYSQFLCVTQNAQNGQMHKIHKMYVLVTKSVEGSALPL